MDQKENRFYRTKERASDDRVSTVTRSLDAMIAIETQYESIGKGDDFGVTGMFMDAAILETLRANTDRAIASAYREGLLVDSDRALSGQGEPGGTDDADFEEVREFGLYRVFWVGGGSELAIIGLTSDGQNWIAPVSFRSSMLLRNLLGQAKVDSLVRISGGQ